MPINWSVYDAFDWANSAQVPLTERGRQELEGWLADHLGVAQMDRVGTWGSASPPGRFAITVIRLADGLAHSHGDVVRESGLRSVGVKLFKKTGDARRESERLVPFHRLQLHRLPGLPSPHVQRSLLATSLPREAPASALVVQEWIEGDLLEDLIRRRWPEAPIAAETSRFFLEQLYGNIIFPLWGAGTIWWDIRDANYCVDLERRHLTLIDVDSLGAFADEVLESPGAWDQQERGRATALPRLRQMTIRLVLAQGLRPKKRVEERVTALWRQHLEPILLRLGRDPSALLEAPEALGRFCEGLERATLPPQVPRLLP